MLIGGGLGAEIKGQNRSAERFAPSYLKAEHVMYRSKESLIDFLWIRTLHARLSEESWEEPIKYEGAQRSVLDTFVPLF